MSTTVQQGTTRPYLRRVRLALVCLSVGANAFVSFPTGGYKLTCPPGYVQGAFSAFRFFRQRWWNT